MSDARCPCSPLLLLTAGPHVLLLAVGEYSAAGDDLSCACAEKAGGPAPAPLRNKLNSTPSLHKSLHPPRKLWEGLLITLKTDLDSNRTLFRWWKCCQVTTCFLPCFSRGKPADRFGCVARVCLGGVARTGGSGHALTFPPTTRNLRGGHDPWWWYISRREGPPFAVLVAPVATLNPEKVGSFCRCTATALYTTMSCT